MSPDCLEENEIVDLVTGNLDAAASERAEAHIDACEPCRTVLVELARVFEHRAASIPPAPRHATTEQSSDDDGELRLLLRGSTVGRYVVLDAIGAGAMGVVYAAYDPELDRRVALKLLRDRALDAKRTERLLREARAIAKLSHPNVVVVHDVGEHEDTVFMAMEYVDGGTLGDWLSAKERSQREIIDAFVDAGRGLAAAHSAGLVHRDFKPANVLVGSEGRVRVTDFGLARPRAGGSTDGARPNPTDAPSLDPETSPRPDERSLTRTGAIVGTPAYMSPEQFAGKVADERSDQFSFCVALFEALCGERPFGGRSFAELAANVDAGRVRESAGLSKLPRGVRQLLHRGLARSPDERFPSMSALLRALTHRPARRLAPYLVGVAAIAGSIGAVASPAKADKCTGGFERVADAWNDQIASAGREAFERSTLPYSGRAWERAEKALDEYAEDWVTSYTDACETHARAEQSDQMLDLRMGCLNVRHAALSEMASILAEADDDVIQRTGRAVDELSPLSACDDLERLQDPMLPKDDATAEQVAATEALLVRSQTSWSLGRTEKSIGQAREALARAREIDHPPLLGNALVSTGALENMLDPSFDVSPYFLDGVSASLAGHDDRRAALGAIAIVGSFADGNAEHVTEADRWAKVAAGLVARNGNAPQLAVHLLHQRLRVATARGDHQAAAALAQERADLVGEHFPDEPKRLGPAMYDLAATKFRLGKYADALPLFDKALALDIEALGPLHPSTGLSRQSVGATLLALRRTEEALVQLRAVLELREATHGKDSATLINPLQNISMAEAELGDIDAALVTNERALRIAKATFGPDHPRTGVLQNAVGASNFECGKVEAAVSHYAEALRILTTPDDPDELEVALTWVNLAEALHAQGNLEEANEHATRATSVLAKHYGEDSSAVAFAKTLLGAIAIDEGRADDAVAALEPALKIRLGEGISASELATTRFELARALHASDPARSASLLAAAKHGIAEDGSAPAKRLAQRIEGWATAPQ